MSVKNRPETIPKQGYGLSPTTTGNARKWRLHTSMWSIGKSCARKISAINDVEIKKDLSQRERMVDFVSQIKNPYCYLDRGMVVKISFAGENRLEDTLKKCARTHRK